MRISGENFLLLLLPVLLLAIVAFVKNRPADIYLMAVGNGGSELIFLRHGTPLDPALLCRDQDGVRTSVKLEKTKGMQPYIVLIAAGDRIAGFTGDKLLLFDSTSLAKVSEQKVSQWDGIGTRYVVSANQKFLFLRYQGSDHENYCRSCIVDLTSGEVTWKGKPFAIGESIRFFGAAEGKLTAQHSSLMVDNTIVDFFPASSAGATQAATCSFETGVPTQIRSGVALPFLSADGERSIIEVPGVGFKLMNQGDEAILEVTLPGDRIEIAAKSEHRILFEHNEYFKFFDWRSMKFENTIKREGDFGARQPVLSADGNTMALQVQKYNYSWSDYLRSGCDFVRSQLVVYDAKTGDRIRVIEDDRPFWVLVVLAIGGSLVWSIAWIRVRSSGRDSNRAISDVLVVSLLWFSIALLRYGFGGWLPDVMSGFHADRPASAAVTCVLGCLMAIIPVWATFAQLRWSFRIPVAVIGVTLLWALQIRLWSHFEFEFGSLRLECLFVLISVSFICTVTRLFGWHLGTTESGSRDDQNRSRQISLIDLFLFPLAIGLAIATFAPIVRDSSIRHWARLAFDSLPIALTAIIALWAAFSTYEKPRRILGLMFLILLIASLTPFHFWNEVAYYTIYGGNTMSSGDAIIAFVSRQTSTACGTGLCALLAMSFVSSQGWKFTRKRRLEPANETETEQVSESSTA